MIEIRVRWSRAQFDDDGLPVTGGLWVPDNPVSRELAERVVSAGDEVYGAGTHWLEERET